MPTNLPKKQKSKQTRSAGADILRGLMLGILGAIALLVINAMAESLIFDRYTSHQYMFENLPD